MPKPEAAAPAPATEVVSDASQSAVSAAAGTSATEPAAEPTRVELAISAWMNGFILNSPVSRSTDAYNHLVSVLPHLAASLEG